MSRYYRTRKKIFAGLDGDKVPSSFVAEGAEHPRFVLVPHITVAAAEVLAGLDGSSATAQIAATAHAAAVTVERLDGRWEYYPDADAATWPARWAEADFEGRVAIARRWAGEEISAIAEVATQKATLTEDEAGESEGR